VDLNLSGSGDRKGWDAAIHDFKRALPEAVTIILTKGGTFLMPRGTDLHLKFLVDLFLNHLPDIYLPAFFKFIPEHRPHHLCTFPPFCGTIGLEVQLYHGYISFCGWQP